jgi:hypothetical protein
MKPRRNSVDQSDTELWKIKVWFGPRSARPVESHCGSTLGSKRRAFIAPVLLSLAAGKHTIRVEAEDFLTWEELASISAKKTIAEFKDTLAPHSRPLLSRRRALAEIK